MSLLVRGQRSLQITLKIKLPKNICLNFFFFFPQTIICLTFSTLKKFGFWDTHGFPRYVQISSFSGDFGTTGVTKMAVSQIRKIFIQCNLYQGIALEVGFHLIGHMYLTLVGGVIRRNHDL